METDPPTTEPLVRMPRFEIVQSDAPQPWHARRRSANGEVRWTTEQYAREGAALAALLDFGVIAVPPPGSGWDVALDTHAGVLEVRGVDER